MRRWMILGAIGGLVGGALSELVVGVLNGVVDPAQIGVEALLWSVGLSIGAAAAYVPSHWAVRGAVGGVTLGVVRAGLLVALARASEPWPAVLGSEVAGGVVGGILLAYLWRPTVESSSGE